MPAVAVSGAPPADCDDPAATALAATPAVAVPTASTPASAQLASSGGGVPAAGASAGSGRVVCGGASPLLAASEARGCRCVVSLHTSLVTPRLPRPPNASKPAMRLPSDSTAHCDTARRAREGVLTPRRKHTHRACACATLCASQPPWGPHGRARADGGRVACGARAHRHVPSEAARMLLRCDLEQVAAQPGADIVHAARRALGCHVVRRRVWFEREDVHLCARANATQVDAVCAVPGAVCAACAWCAWCTWCAGCAGCPWYARCPRYACRV
eukprot:7388189-Prymnesium_polylepis.1